MGHIDYRWSAIRAARGDLPPVLDGLEFFGDLSNAGTSIISGAVAQLGDSSGNGRAAPQGTSMQRPSYTAVDSDFGGRPSMTFDGTNSNLSTTALLPSQNDATLVCVFKPTFAIPVVTTSRGAMGIGPISSDGAFGLFAPSGTSILRSRFENPAASITSRDSATIAQNSIYRVVSTFRPSTEASTVAPVVYIDGSVSSSASTIAATNGQTRNSAIRVGSLNASSRWLGKIVDPIIYSRALSATEVALVDDWLKWRNGL